MLRIVILVAGRYENKREGPNKPKGIRIMRMCHADIMLTARIRVEHSFQIQIDAHLHMRNTNRTNKGRCVCSASSYLAKSVHPSVDEDRRERCNQHQQ